MSASINQIDSLQIPLYMCVSYCDDTLPNPPFLIPINNFEKFNDTIYQKKSNNTKELVGKRAVERTKCIAFTGLSSPSNKKRSF